LNRILKIRRADSGMKKQSFLYGAAVLAAASLLCKIMSAALKIPLDRFFLHEEGIAVYQSAYSIYNVFLAICVTGIPIALSKLVAQSNKKEAASLCKSTLVIVSVFGALGAAGLVIFANPVARLLSGGEEAVAASSLRMLAPALLVMGIVSSRRGYFQGNSDMTPSALSQLAESFTKVVLGIAMCSLTVKWGIAYGACGAISGVSIGAVMSALVLEVFFRRTKREKGAFSSALALKVLKLSVPMTLGAFGFTGVMLADTLTVPKILAFGGMDTIERLKMFGYLTRANTIYNLPATIITAFTASAVPAIACSIGEKNNAGVSENSLKAIKLIFLVAMPCALGMGIFAKEILALLYSGSQQWQLLALTGAMILIMPYVQTITAMLQTMGKVWQPIWVSVGAIVLKAGLNFLFIRMFGIIGAPLSTIAAFVPAMIINTIMLQRRVQIKGAIPILVKMAVCALISCISARAVYTLHPTPAMLLVAVAMAAVLYIAGILLSGCIRKDELKV